MSPGLIGTYMLPRTGDATRQAAALNFIHFITGPGYAAFIAPVRKLPAHQGAQGPANTSRLLNDIKAAYDKGPRAPPIKGSRPGGLLNGIAMPVQNVVASALPTLCALDPRQRVLSLGEAPPDLGTCAPAHHLSRATA